MSKFCTKCGNELENCTCPKVPENSVDATNWFISLKNRMGVGEPETNSVDCYERGKKIVPESISPNDGEIPVKQYDVAVLRTRLKFMRAEGRIQVTNKRLFFRATGRSIMGRTTLQHEFAIDEIAGLEVRKDYRFGFIDLIFGSMIITLFAALFVGITGYFYQLNNIFGTIIALLLGVAAGAPFFLWNKRFFAKLITCGASLGCFSGVSAGGLFAGLIGQNSGSGNDNGLIFLLMFLAAIIALIDLFLFSFKPNLIFTIKNKSAGGAIEIRREKSKGILGLLIGNIFSEKEEYTGYAEVLPTKNTEKSIREIGAIITDIQKLGDFGIEKWKND